MVAEEPVNLQTVIAVRRMDGAENIDVDLVPRKAGPRAHDLIEGAAPTLRDAVGVVHGLWTIDAQADQETMRLEEARPFVVQQHAVGLDRVHDLLARPLVLRHHIDGSPEKRQTHQCRLASLPLDFDLRVRLRGHQLAAVALQHIVGHPQAPPHRTSPCSGRNSICSRGCSWRRSAQPSR